MLKLTHPEITIPDSHAQLLDVEDRCPHQLARKEAQLTRLTLGLDRHVILLPETHP